MKLKLDDAGHAVLQDGKPVYTSDDGKDIAFDAPGTVATITRLNGEAKSHRERAEAAEKAMKAFEGITDPAEAIKAMGIVANLDAKKLIDAGEAQRVRDEITKGFTEKLTAAEKRAADLETNWSRAEINRAFAGSKFIADKSAIPADFLQAALAGQMRFEGGRVTAYDAAGNKMLSRAKPGEDAGFDEAIELLIDAHPQRDSILKGNTNGGGGARQPAGNGAGRTMKTADFNAMPPKDRAAAMAAGTTLID